MYAIKDGVKQVMARTRGCQNLDSFDYNKTTGILETFQCPSFFSSQGLSQGTKMSLNLLLPNFCSIQSCFCHPNRLSRQDLLVGLMSMDIILAASHHGSLKNYGFCF